MVFTSVQWFEVCSSEEGLVKCRFHSPLRVVDEPQPQRSKSPRQFWLVVKSRKLDNPPADGDRFYLQRCFPKKDTAASYEFLSLRAVDATAASLSGSELRAVKETSEDAHR